MTLIVILNLETLVRSLLRRKPREQALNDPGKRAPAQAAQLARDVLRRMLERRVRRRTRADAKVANNEENRSHGGHDLGGPRGFDLTANANGMARQSLLGGFLFGCVAVNLKCNLDGSI